MHGTPIQSAQWLQWGAVLGASLVAALSDIRCGLIPNLLTLPLWGLGLAQAAWRGGTAGLGEALEVSALLALPYLVLFFLAGGGAGDAKLMGAIGAWLSFSEGLAVLGCVMLAGVILALLKIAAQRERKNVLLGVLAMLYVMGIACCTGVRGWGLLAGTGETPAGRENGQTTLPYGAAVFIGVCLAAGVQIWTT